ncbi:23190_t:CDS:1, partial [Gigaspora margarita]
NPLSLNSDDTYDADMIDRRIYIGESYDDDFCYRFFRKKDLKKLYVHFLKQVMPLVKRIMDLSYHPNDERLCNKLNGHFFVITDLSIQEIINGNLVVTILFPKGIVFANSFGRPLHGIWSGLQEIMIIGVEIE